MKKTIIFAVLLNSVTLFCGTESWTGLGGPGSWGDTAKWSPNIVPDSIDEIAILGSGPPPPLFPAVITLSAGIDRTLGTLRFDFDVSYTVRSSSTETLILSVSSGSAAIEVKSSVGTPSHMLQTPLMLANPLIVTQDLAAPGTFTMSGAISEMGSQSLTKEGSEILTLSGVNSYSGGTFINLGTLRIGTDQNLGNSSGALNINNGTLLVTNNLTTNRSGSFTGALAAIDSGVHTVTLLGSFSGSGALTKRGAGTLFLLGNNSYMGPTTVSSGTLEGNSNSLQGDIAIGVGTSVIFNQGSNGVYAGSLSGTGSLTKNGAGRLEFTGDGSTFTGSTFVNQGELKVNGALGSSVDIMGGSVLSGTGPFGPITVQSGGVFAPGNSITTSLVVGPFMYMPGSFYSVDINPLISDLTIITGTATLSGAHILVLPEPGFYGFTNSYTIISSSTLLGTVFADVTSSNPNILPSLSYTLTDVILILQVPNPFAGFPFYNQNAQSVANNFVNLFSLGELSTDLLSVVNSFSSLSFSEINLALDQLHPALYSGLVELQAENGAQLISLFHRPPALGCDCNRLWRFWAKPSASALSIKNTDDQLGFDATTGGIAIGCDRELFDQFFIGVGAAWNNSCLKWNNHRGSSDINGIYGGAYADYRYKDFYLGGAILPGIDLYDTSRHISFSSIDRYAKADGQMLDIVGQLTSAYYFDASDAWAYPYGTVDFLYLHAGDIDEKGASGLNLDIEDRTAFTIRTELGFTVEGKGKEIGDEGCILPTFSLGWVYINPTVRDSFQARFEGSEIAFTTKGWDRSWNLISMDLGLKLSYKCFNFDLAYNVEVSADGVGRYLDQHGNATLSWQW